MSNYFECKLYKERVREKIKTFVFDLIERELKDSQYDEIGNFIDENGYIINEIIDDVMAITEHRIDKVFFPPSSSYCAWNLKSRDDFAVVRGCVYRHIDFGELKKKGLKKMSSPHTMGYINKNIKRTCNRIVWSINEDIEKTLVTKINPSSGKKYTLDDALHFMDIHSSEIELFVIDFLTQYIKKMGNSDFYSIFNHKIYYLKTVKTYVINHIETVPQNSVQTSDKKPKSRKIINILLGN